jgi:hypothetical protein
VGRPNGWGGEGRVATLVGPGRGWRDWSGSDSGEPALAQVDRGLALGHGVGLLRLLGGELARDVVGPLPAHLLLAARSAGQARFGGVLWHRRHLPWGPSAGGAAGPLRAASAKSPGSARHPQTNGDGDGGQVGDRPCLPPAHCTISSRNYRVDSAGPRYPRSPSVNRVGVRWSGPERSGVRQLVRQSGTAGRRESPPNRVAAVVAAVGRGRGATRASAGRFRAARSWPRGTGAGRVRRAAGSGLGRGRAGSGQRPNPSPVQAGRRRLGSSEGAAWRGTPDERGAGARWASSVAKRRCRRAMIELAYSPSGGGCVVGPAGLVMAGCGPGLGSPLRPRSMSAEPLGHVQRRPVGRERGRLPVPAATPMDRGPDRWDLGRRWRVRWWRCLFSAV